VSWDLKSYSILLLATLCAYITVRLMIWLNVKDNPNERSSHIHVTPTSGGLSVLTALIVISVGLSLWNWAVFLICAIVIAGLGLIDDMRGFKPLLKFTVMFGIAIFTALNIPIVTYIPITETLMLPIPYWLWVSFAVLWIIVLLNAVNFMDGANGMLVLTTLPAASLLTFLYLSAGHFIGLWAAAILIGLVVFAFFNLRRQVRVFAGDAGSLCVGYVLAVLSLMHVSIAETRIQTYVLLFLIWPILLDVFMTLLRRARAGRPLTEAHNEHLYQRYIQMGYSHLCVSFTYGVLSALILAFGAVLMSQSVVVIQLCSLALIVGSIIIYCVLYRKAMHQLTS